MKEHLFVMFKTYLDAIAYVFKMVESRRASMLSHAMVTLRDDDAAN
jgi:hypothetical protein